MQTSDERALSRRVLLRQLGSAPALAVTAPALIASSQMAQAYDPGSTETQVRYRETEHVKAFYRTNGYETLQR